jgi:uncharacterized protein (TIGR02284 family)
MADRNERWVLNHLIEMCRDEELTLRYAGDHVKDPSVKALFVELASRRAQFAADLVPHAQRLGGAEAADRTTRGALHRRWMAIKGALIGYSDRAMIAEAEQDEDLVLAIYENALDDMLPPTVRELVERQRAEIRLAHDRVQALLSH